MPTLTHQIHQFYQRWHALEENLGPKGGSVLDFDLAPRRETLTLSPFFDRRAALSALMDIRSLAGAATWLNGDMVRLKLAGAELYLRQLLGQNIPFAESLENMMGCAASYISKEDLKDDRQAVQETIAKLGYDFTPEGYQQFDGAQHRGDMSTFEADLRENADRWLEQIQQQTGIDGGEDLRNFRLEVVHKDAYWSNWIDGNSKSGIRLQVNTHPRIRYTKTSHIGLAAHEIGGHALHVASLLKGVKEGRVDAVLTNLAVHSAEAFHMEGLAQGVCQLLGASETVSLGAKLREQLSRYHQGLLNNAHLDLEAGGDPLQIMAETIEASPFIRKISVVSSLQDRRRDPLLRVYQFVYGPARRLFERALVLSTNGRAKFMASMYQSLMTPQQIEALLDDCLKDERADLREIPSLGAVSTKSPTNGPATTPSTLDLLTDLHTQLGTATRKMQTLILEGNMPAAKREMEGLLVDLRLHIQGEEKILFPAYEAAVPEPGRGAGRAVFEAEHAKILSLGEDFQRQLAKKPMAAPLTSEERLQLLEGFHPFKALMEHHERREEMLLAPSLDLALGEEVGEVHRHFLGAL